MRTILRRSSTQRDGVTTTSRYRIVFSAFWRWMRESSGTAGTAGRAVALAYAVLGVAFVVTMLVTPAQYGGWEMLMGCAAWGVLVRRWVRRANAAQVLELQAELATERGEVERLQLELGERHQTIGLPLPHVSWSSIPAGVHAGRTWRWAPGWQCDGPKVLVTIPDSEGDGYELLLALEPVLERLLGERLGDGSAFGGVIEQPATVELVPPVAVVEPAQQHRCALPGVRAGALFRPNEPKPQMRPAELTYVGAIVRCTECGQHWECELDDSEAWWDTISRRRAERAVRRLERGQRNGQR